MLAAVEPSEFERFIRSYGSIAYHYTQKSNVESILAHGLDPQRSRAKSPTEKFGQIYLFTKGSEPYWLINPDTGTTSRIAVNLKMLDPAKIEPDDDLLLQFDNAWDSVFHSNEWPDVLPTAQEDDARLSLWDGQFAYRGVIPPDAVSYDGDVDLEWG